MENLQTQLSDEMTGALVVPMWDKGDDRVEWNKKNKESVDAARRRFTDLKAQGYKAYRLDPKSNEKGEIIKEFDESAEKIIMTPPFAGG